jgi:hypothetical protein
MSIISNLPWHELITGALSLLVGWFAKVLHINLKE